MAKFRLAAIAEVARQLGFVPRGKRLEQLTSAEDLLLRLDPEQGYPIDFVKHGITGYRAKADLSKNEAAAELLIGSALQHDLGLLIEAVSDGLDVQVGGAGEPVLDISDVCARFGVTSKTIQRWRRRGLPARRWIFDDGKKRIGFRLSCVERFIAAQSGSAERPAGIDPMTGAEHDQSIAIASRLSAAGHDRQEIIRRVARRMGRSSLAILHNLELFDRQHPAEAILAGAPDPAGKSTARQAIEALEAGRSLGDIAREQGLSRVAVYRLFIQARAEKLVAATVNFHDDELYHGNPIEAETQLRQIVEAAEAERDHNLACESDEVARRIPRNVPPYLADLYRTPLLTPRLERALFLQFNFYKSQFSRLRSELDPHLCNRRQQRQLEYYLARSREVKNRITQANLRLVVSVARKHVRGNLDIMELISDGNIVLMRAVEGFDVHRGFRFSTYATLALMKGFARSVPAMQASQGGGPSVEPETIGRVDDSLGRVASREQLESLLTNLESRECEVLLARWGVGRDDEASLEVLGQRFGLTKYRIRQIEQGAIRRLRDAVEAV